MLAERYISRNHRVSYLLNYQMMKVILLLITVLFSSMALSSCTNDEGDSDLDIITPNDEQERVSTQLENENSN